MRKVFSTAALVMFLVSPPHSFGQSSNGRISGTVADGTGALIPGADVTATNTATGVVTNTLSNETGTYNFASLLPGEYTVSAELTGFQTATFTEVGLGTSAQIRLNFSLEVGTLATAIEVSVSGDQILLESSSSVGDVLAEDEVRSLPTIGTMGSDVLSLVRAMAGVQMTDSAIFGANRTTFAGVSAANIQITRDGIESGASARWPNGVEGATVMNPDLVGEIRMILAPVDAEIGRGNAQIQIRTRSGTNNYRGALVWNVQNSALDPNTWSNNRALPEPATRQWTNLHEFTVSFGGPIIRNKTHFFVLFDGLLPQSRSNINATVLTPCAANGIFRYYDNWNNGNAFATTTGGGTPTIAVVDQAGNLLPPAANPDGTTHNGTLRYASVFGALPAGTVSNSADCSDIAGQVTPGTNWDPFRTGFDSTGYIQQVFDVMPEVNNYEVGDGLNVGGHRWERANNGATNRFGIGSANERQQINIRIDHIFNQTHKLNAGYSYENNESDYSPGNWPTLRFPGKAFREPQVLTLNFTSTLSPNLLNEFRFGMRRSGTNTNPALSNPDTAEAAQAFYPNVNGIPVFVEPGTDPICFCGGQPGGGSQAGNLFNGNVSESSPMYTFADTMSWTRGVHGFKFGVEARFPKTTLGIDVTGNDWSTYSRAFGGETDRTPIVGIDRTNIPGLAGTQTSGNNEAMRGMLNLLSGSLSRVTELFWLGSADTLTTWDDYRDNIQRIRTLNQREFSSFFKDDWKLTQNLTLNLGMRWDYYGVPWVSDGLTAAPIGGGDALFGYSGRGFENWMVPGQRGDNTELQFVGPGSPNPGLRPWARDLNNFGPAIGFAYQVPWLGGDTAVRGGYQLTYLLDRLGSLDGTLANPPGSTYRSTFDGGPGDLEYLDLTDITGIVPTPVTVQPMETIPVTDRGVSLTAFAPNRVAPYIQNLTMAVTRNIGPNLSLDVRYIGTLSRKLIGTVNINEENFLTNGLLEAFNAARAGNESALLDNMFNGINVAGRGFGEVGSTLNGVLQTGAMHLRGAATTRNNLARGNYEALSSTLNTLNYSKAGGRNAALPDIPAGVRGAVLRQNGFPENFIKTNPQFNSANYNTNIGHANYHSLQVKTTLRPTAGINFQTTYTWSKSLGLPGQERFTTPLERSLDYTLQRNNPAHNFRTYGTFRLPVGPNQLLLGGTSGAVARVIEGWEMSWIANFSTGSPVSIQAQDMLYDAGVPDLVGSFDPSAGAVQWDDGARAGNYFGGAYTKVRDPQCGAIAASLRSRCNLNAIADSAGNIVLQHPQPGTRGNLGQNVVELPGVWSLDTAMSKSFQVGEDLRFQIRFDALNLFNHPQPSAPNLRLAGGTPFGNIASKRGNRTMKAQLRLDF